MEAPKLYKLTQVQAHAGSSCTVPKGALLEHEAAAAAAAGTDSTSICTFSKGLMSDNEVGSTITMSKGFAASSKDVKLSIVVCIAALSAESEPRAAQCCSKLSRATTMCMYNESMCRF